MSWLGPALEQEQRDLLAMLDALASDREVVLDDEPGVVAGLRSQLAALGVLTVGTAESAGGGGADPTTTAVALERLGRYWPALGWAAVQAHAAVDLLADVPAAAETVAALHAGAGAVAVVEAGADHVDLAWADGRLRGHVARVDAAAEQPALLVLVDASTALLVPPSGSTPRPLRRTGLAGALTRSLDVAAVADDVVVVSDAPVAAARVRLRLGAAAVAAGIAGAAVDQAAGYAAGRHQFGGALTEIPTVRQALLDQRTRAAASLAAVLAGPSDPVGAYAALVGACETAIDVCAAALQSHGGYGYLTEYPAERYLRDAVSLRAAADVIGAARLSALSVVGADPAPQPLGVGPA